MIAALQARGQVSEWPRGNQRSPSMGIGSPHKAHKDIRSECAVLHSVVQHHHPQCGARCGHALEPVQPVFTHGHGHSRQARLHHPRFVAGITPRLCVLHPQKACRLAAVSTAQDADGAFSQQPFQSVRDIEDMRGFAGAAQFDVADDQGG